MNYILSGGLISVVGYLGYKMFYKNNKIENKNILNNFVCKDIVGIINKYDVNKFSEFIPNKISQPFLNSLLSNLHNNFKVKVMTNDNTLETTIKNNNKLKYLTTFKFQHIFVIFEGTSSEILKILPDNRILGMDRLATFSVQKPILD